MTTELRIDEWSCVKCGYRMTAARRVDGLEQVQPGEHDLSMCLNCGAVYEMSGGKWRLFTDAEVRQLPEELQRFLKRKEQDRKALIKKLGDLQIEQKLDE